ncbi:DUF2520 domain-containing protein [Ramlibacter tataouinensis]|uniref:Rossmann-like and DUF2520 domain-containing protein n=1 Tax=Ramlibacter tataouinensis TaxID=94132 RepID=UPI0022F3E199|nr:DUF2520 domain-containing protein [Ramlibacter tataouinensis]WBY01044.1 DUF2520 domain-containing protein [Ramlibacter tataouinensis]
MATLNIIGCGRVGQTLGRLFHASGTLELQDLKGFDAGEAGRAADFIQAGRPVTALDDMRPADVWLLSVPDTRIAQVAAELAGSAAGRARASPRAPVAFHCSGCLPAAELAALRELGFHLASTHPVFTFADPAAAVTQFQGTPFGLEGDEPALERLRPVIEAIGGVCFDVPTERKPLYHAAAVFSNNFTVVLQAIAREAWAEAGVPEDLAVKMQSSLLHATAEGVSKLGPRAITGPAARGDLDVVRAQAAEVARWHPDAGVVYRELSRLAQRLAVQQSTLARPPR